MIDIAIPIPHVVPPSDTEIRIAMLAFVGFLGVAVILATIALKGERCWDADSIMQLMLGLFMVIGSAVTVAVITGVLSISLVPI